MGMLYLLHIVCLVTQMLFNIAVIFSGDKALSQILEDARKVAERCTDPADRDRILKTVSDIDSMKNALSELRVQGKVSICKLQYLFSTIFDRNSTFDLIHCTISIFS